VASSHSYAYNTANQRTRATLTNGGALVLWPLLKRKRA
jgi:hypothetical protein